MPIEAATESIASLRSKAMLILASAEKPLHFTQLVEETAGERADSATVTLTEEAIRSLIRDRRIDVHAECFLTVTARTAA